MGVRKATPARVARVNSAAERMRSNIGCRELRQRDCCTEYSAEGRGSFRIICKKDLGIRGEGRGSTEAGKVSRLNSLTKGVEREHDGSTEKHAISTR